MSVVPASGELRGSALLAALGYEAPALRANEPRSLFPLHELAGKAPRAPITLGRDTRGRDGRLVPHLMEASLIEAERARDRLTAAYALRRVRQAYRGPLVRVVLPAHSATAEVDLYGGAAGAYLVTRAGVPAAAALPGASHSNLEVVAWYDQGPAGNHLVAEPGAGAVAGAPRRPFLDVSSATGPALRFYQASNTALRFSAPASSASPSNLSATFRRLDTAHASGFATLLGASNDAGLRVTNAGTRGAASTAGADYLAGGGTYYLEGAGLTADAPLPAGAWRHLTGTAGPAFAAPRLTHLGYSAAHAASGGRGWEGHVSELLLLGGAATHAPTPASAAAEAALLFRARPAAAGGLALPPVRPLGLVPGGPGTPDTRALGAFSLGQDSAARDVHARFADFDGSAQRVFVTDVGMASWPAGSVALSAQGAGGALTVAGDFRSNTFPVLVTACNAAGASTTLPLWVTESRAPAPTLTQSLPALLSGLSNVAVRLPLASYFSAAPTFGSALYYTLTANPVPAAAAVSATELTVTPAYRGCNYGLTVSASNRWGISTASSTTASEMAKVDSASATAKSSTAVTVTWTGGSYTHVVVSWAVTAGSGGSSGSSAAVNMGTATYEATGLSPNVTYAFTVTPYSVPGAAGVLATASTTTLATVSGVTATAQSPSTVNVGWGGVYSKVRVAWSNTSSDQTGTSYTAGSLSASTGYTFTVTPYNRDGVVGAASSAQATTPYTPTITGFSASASGTSITITWGGSFASVNLEGYGNASSGVAVTSLAYSTTYTYYITAFNNLGNASGRYSASGTTGPQPAPQPPPPSGGGGGGGGSTCTDYNISGTWQGYVLHHEPCNPSGYGVYGGTTNLAISRGSANTYVFKFGSSSDGFYVVAMSANHLHLTWTDGSVTEWRR